MTLKDSSLFLRVSLFFLINCLHLSWRKDYVSSLISISHSLVMLKRNAIQKLRMRYIHSSLHMKHIYIQRRSMKHIIRSCIVTFLRSFKHVSVLVPDVCEHRLNFLSFDIDVLYLFFYTFVIRNVGMGDLKINSSRTWITEGS